jgi:hypothetical protein
MFLFESKDLMPSSRGALTPKFSRAEVHKSAEIPASAQEVWNLLTDWAGMMRWWLVAERGGLAGPTLVSIQRFSELLLKDSSLRASRRHYQSGALFLVLPGSDLFFERRGDPEAVGRQRDNYLR